MMQRVVDQSTNAIAAAGVSSPLWIPPLKDLSEVAALILPILGVVWLVVQIVAKLRGK